MAGKRLELVTRDDNANPGDAVRVAEELLSREKIDVLTGTFLSHIGLAVTDFAKQKKVFFLAGEPLTDKIVWSNGNPYTYRLRPSTYMQVAMLVPEAAKLKKKRWAVVFPNYEYGQSAVASFKALLKQAQPDVEFVGEQAPPLGKLDAGPVVQALADARPDAIFNVLFGADLAKFVREGNTRVLFKGREVVSLLTCEPEYLDPLKDESPNGWIVTGYPWNGINTPEHKAFLGWPLIREALRAMGRSDLIGTAPRHLVPRDQPVVLDRSGGNPGGGARRTGKTASPVGARRAPPPRRGGKPTR